MKPTTLEGVGSHGEAIYRGWVKPAGADEGPQYIDLQNDSGVSLLEGDVVVVLSDGTIGRTTTANDPRPTGVCIDDIDDGESGPVQFFGPVDLIHVTAAVTAGEYGATSSTAGQAEASTTGAFVYFTTSGAEPEGFLFGGGGGSGGGGSVPEDEFLLREGGEQHAVSTVAASGSAETLDLSAANAFDITLTANCTLTFSNPPSSGTLGIWTLILRQDGTGSRTVTWPGTVQWQDTDGTSGGAAPTLFTAANAENVVLITTLDGGLSYGGSSQSVASGGASELDDLSDVTITSPTEDEQLQYISGQWVNNARRWEPVTHNFGSGPELVWDGDSLVMEWKEY